MGWCKETVPGSPLGLTWLTTGRWGTRALNLYLY
jgi:hypothetical protein